jgi:hypothetical protein
MKALHFGSPDDRPFICRERSGSVVSTLASTPEGLKCSPAEAHREAVIPCLAIGGIRRVPRIVSRNIGAEGVARFGTPSLATLPPCRIVGVCLRLAGGQHYGSYPERNGDPEEVSH